MRTFSFPTFASISDATASGWRYLTQMEKKTLYVIVTVSSVFVGLGWVAITPMSYQAKATLAATSSDDNRASTLGGLGQISQSLGVSLNANNLSQSFGHFQLLLTSVYLSRLIDEKYHVADILGLPLDNTPTDLVSEIKRGVKRLLGIPTQTMSRSEQLYQVINDGLGITPDLQTQTIEVTFNNAKPEIAKRLLTILIHEADDILKQRAVHRSKDEIDYWSKQLGTISDPDLRANLYPGIISSEATLLKSSSNLPYSVEIMDEPFVPSRPDWPRPMWQILIVVIIFQIFFFSLIGYKYLLPENSIFKKDGFGENTQ